MDGRMTCFRTSLALASSSRLNDKVIFFAVSNTATAIKLDATEANLLVKAVHFCFFVIGEIASACACVCARGYASERVCARLGCKISAMHARSMRGVNMA